MKKNHHSSSGIGNYYLKKILLTMKITTLLFFTTLIQLSANSYSQSEKLSLQLNNATLKEMFAAIEKQTGYKFLYRDDVLESIPVTLSATNQPLTEILSKAFENSSISYKVLDNNLIVIASKETLQQQKVTGTVTDATNGEPIIGANVIIEGTTSGTVTDVNGKYSLDVNKANDIIIISFIGYNTERLTYTGQSTLNVQLIPDITKLDEIVVIGYGIQKRKDLTGAFAQVKSDDLTKETVTGLDQALQGKMSGVQVTNNSGEPGGGVSIRIRGVGSINSNNEPLVVIDGVPGASINSINVNDIDRIDVLKDAAAASIYGSRASNGVILVTTKRGKKGLTINFDAYAGVQSVAKKIKMLNGSQFAKLANENLVNSGIAPNPMWSDPSKVLNNDWQSALFQTAPIQNYNLSISAGGDRSSTMFSIGYLKQDGIIVGSGYERYTARVNTDYNVTKRLKLGLTINGAFDTQQNIGTNNDFGGAINQALYMQPTSPIKTSQNGLFGLKSDGSIDPTGDTFYGWNGSAFTSQSANPNYLPTGVNNPVYQYEYYIKSPNKTQSIAASAFAELEVLPGLKIKSTMNLNYGHGFNEYSSDYAPKAITMVGNYYAVGEYSQTWNQLRQLNWVNTIAYNKSFGNHNISAVAGMDALQRKTLFVAVGASGAPADQQSINASNAASIVTTGFPLDYGLLSYFGRLSYDYNGKYLISATIRNDGSSNFGPGKKWGLFKSGSLGWRISQEEFMKSVELISDLKLRASYGAVGNENIAPFSYLSKYTSFAGTYNYTLGRGQNAVNGISQSNYADPNIHWEKSTQTDIGIDLALMKGKIAITADYYIKKLSDLLGYFAVPSYTGVPGSSILSNGFSMENKGLEFSIDYREKIGQVNLSIGGNFATLHNEITKLYDDSKTYLSHDISVHNGTINDGSPDTRLYVGQSLGEFYGYQTDGIIQNTAEAAAYKGIGELLPGDRKYRDNNNDTIINGSDKVALGNGLPKYTFGFNLKAEYKAWDFSANFSGQAGVQIANMLKFQLYNMHYNNSTGIVNGSADLVNSWNGEGTSNTLPRNSYNAPTSNRWFSDFSVENGNYLRISNVQIGYTLKESLTKKINISHLRLYISGQNLYTFTNYSGYDPEIGSRYGNALQTGVDMGRYPRARIFTFGVNCRF